MQMEREIPKHRKKSGKKPFVVQYRLISEKYDREWVTHSKYSREVDRDKALAALQSKTCYGMKMFEYRARS